MGMSSAERSRRYNAKKVIKICPACHQPNEVKMSATGLCVECKKQRRLEFRPPTFKKCEQCGKEFGPVGYLSVRFCSRACKGLWSSSRPGGKLGRKYPESQKAETRKCLSCDADFRAVKDTKRRRQLYCSHHCYLKNRRVSFFECRVFDFLESRGVIVERQPKRGKWSFDGALTGTAILVEADGAFWHSGAKVKDRDKRKNDWAVEHGYELLRVPELLFYADPAKATDIILSRFESCTGKVAELID